LGTPGTPGFRELDKKKTTFSEVVFFHRRLCIYGRKKILSPSHIQVIVGKLSPPFSGHTPDLLPFALHDILVH
jgi:hypothetical protein